MTGKLGGACRAGCGQTFRSAVAGVAMLLASAAPGATLADRRTRRSDLRPRQAAVSGACAIAYPPACRRSPPSISSRTSTHMRWFFSADVAETVRPAHDGLHLDADRQATGDGRAGAHHDVLHRRDRFLERRRAAPGSRNYRAPNSRHGCRPPRRRCWQCACSPRRMLAPCSSSRCGSWFPQ